MEQSFNKKQRDYRAEYQRRVERGLAKGLSRSQARGHPKAKEKNVRKPRPINDDVLQMGVKLLRSGQTLTEAARIIRVSPERLRNQARARGIIKKQGRQWIVRNDLPRQMLIYSNGQAFSIVVGKLRYASAIGRYMAAVKRFLISNEPGHLQPFIGKSVIDRGGTTFGFETNPNALYRLSVSGTESFEQVYRIVI